MSVGGLFDGLKGTQSATAVGLVLHGAGQHTNYEMDFDKKILYKRSSVIENNDVGSIGLSKDASQVDLGSLKITQNTGDLSGIKTTQEDKHDNIFMRFYKWVSQLF